MSLPVIYASISLKSENPNLRAALVYAACGWRVFPLRPGDKRPATPDHPGTACAGADPQCARAGVHVGWQDRATTCLDRITRAWTRKPGWGVGIACGPSGLVVVDLDQPKPGHTMPDQWVIPGVITGADVLAVLASQAGQPYPDTTYTVATPSGGTHLYFTHPEHLPASNPGEGFQSEVFRGGGFRLGNTTGSGGAGLGPLIDTRANGGYVVAPPTTINAHPYQVTRDIPPQPLPDWLITALTPPPRPPAPAAQGSKTSRVPSRVRGSRYVMAAVNAECERVTTAASGGRNHTVFTAAIALGQLVAAGALTEDHARTVLMDACHTHIGVDGFTTSEAATAITSGLARGQNEPRHLPAA